MKKAYTEPAGYHRHKCDRCGLIYEHADSCRGDLKAHKCPRCGLQEIGFRYHGDSPPDQTTRTEGGAK